jgi:hypothetical protein
LFANDAEIKIEAGKCSNNYGCETLPPPPSNKQVVIYNRGTAALTSVNLNYTINGGSNQTQTWNGSLAQNESAVVTLLNTAVYGALNVSVATNGVTDQRASNNTATATFTEPVAPTNYTFNNFTFTLQQDFYGSETTWNLKDGSGAILHSGGPYTDSPTLPALITENWALNNNQCYTFTINDKSGDGICCGSVGGDGYYSLKSTSGTTTILAGTEFGYSDTVSFTINTTLGTNEFEMFDAIYLYPNPTKGTLNIQVPSNFGLPNSYSINNSLGQIITRKDVSKEADLIVNTSFLTNGVYFITITKEHQKKTFKFIKE